MINIISGYYNDICYTTTSEDGTDITLKDRRDNYGDGDKIICQEDCVLTQYDSENFRAKCSCNVKDISSSIIDVNFDKIDKTKLIKNYQFF